MQTFTVASLVQCTPFYFGATDAVVPLAKEGSDLFLDCNEGNLPLPEDGTDLGAIRVELDSVKFE